MLNATLLRNLFLILLLMFANYLIQVSSRSPKDGSYYKRIPKSSAIKVIDFGSTTYDRQNQTYVVSTRHYRAPEVILGKEFKYLGVFSIILASTKHSIHHIYFRSWMVLSL